MSSVSVTKTNATMSSNTRVVRDSKLPLYWCSYSAFIPSRHHPASSISRPAFDFPISSMRCRRKSVRQRQRPAPCPRFPASVSSWEVYLQLDIRQQSITTRWKAFAIIFHIRFEMISCCSSDAIIDYSSVADGATRAHKLESWALCTEKQSPILIPTPLVLFCSFPFPFPFSYSFSCSFSFSCCQLAAFHIIESSNFSTCRWINFSTS